VRVKVEEVGVRRNLSRLVKLDRRVDEAGIPLDERIGIPDVDVADKVIVRS
jgi:hypothetical protein